MTWRDLLTSTSNATSKGRTRNMNRRRKPTTETAIPVHIDRERYYAQVDKARAAGIRDGWVENLRVRAVPRLVASLAADAGQVEPGHLLRPDVPWRRYEPKFTGDGAIQIGEWEAVEWTAEEAAAVTAFEDDQRARSQLVEAAGAIMDDVEGDMSRAWEMFLHLEALDAIDSEDAMARQEAEERDEKRRRFECPVCVESNVEVIGEVAKRTLLAGAYASPWWGEPPTITSCLACWHIASSAFVSNLARAEVGSGGTRAQAVWRALDEADAGAPLQALTGSSLGG